MLCESSQIPRRTRLNLLNVNKSTWQVFWLGIVRALSLPRISIELPVTWFSVVPLTAAGPLPTYTGFPFSKHSKSMKLAPGAWAKSRQKTGTENTQNATHLVSMVLKPQGSGPHRDSIQSMTPAGSAYQTQDPPQKLSKTDLWYNFCLKITQETYEIADK